MRNSNRRLRLVVLFGLVAAATAFAHWPALDARSLFFDDHQYLVTNPLVRNPSWGSAGRFLTEVLKPSTVGGYYQPLTMISLMLDCAMGGEPQNLRAFHRTSLALHVVNTVLIAVLLFLLFDDVAAAGLAALLFGVHPLTVEPIPWVGERKTLLATFFAMLSLIAYVRYARAVWNGVRRVGGSGVQGIGDSGGQAHSRTGAQQYRAWRWFTACVVFFVLALMSKPTSTPLPMAILLLDVWPLKRWSRRAVVEKIPLLGLSVIFAAITYVSQAASYVQTPVQVGMTRIPLIICHNIIFYLWKMVWPVDFVSGYPFPSPFDLSQPMVRAGLVGTIILLVILIAATRWTAAPLVSWLIFFLLILPTMGVIGFTIVIASDKYVYLPSIGLLMLLTFALARFRRVAPRGGSVVMVLLCVLIATLEARATRRYLAVWRDDETLYKHILAYSPTSSTLHFGLGYSYQWHGRLAEAADEYQRALELDPRNIPARIDLALMMYDEGRYAEAAEYFRSILELSPGDVEAHSNLALALIALGKLDEAIQECHRALEIKQDCPPARSNLGVALNRKNQPNQAIEEFRAALRADPDFFEARSNLAATFWRLGKIADAADEYRELIRRHPESPASHYELGRILSSQGRWQEAARELQEAVRIDPGHAGAADALRAAIRQLDK